MCLHPQVAAITAMVNDPASTVASVVRTFGVSRGAVDRHVRGIHAGVDSSASRPLDLLREGTESERLERYRDRVEDDVRAGRVRSVDAMRELRALSKAILDARGGPAPTAVKFNEVAGLPGLMADMLVELEAFPEARLALVAVLERHWPEITGEGGA